MENNPVGHERRRTGGDRRKAERSGKFDRRKNVCGSCQFYHPLSPSQGMCRKHQETVGIDAFSCVWFRPVPTATPSPDSPT